MKLKLDENLSRHLKPALAALGNDVLTAADEGLLSQPDSAIASAARTEDRPLLTLDLHFSDIRRFPPGTHPGIILFRPSTLGPLEVNRFITSFVRHQDLLPFAHCLVIAEADRIRIRRPD